MVIDSQVHDRLPYLQKLLESLSRSRWIERALLVFSHDIHSDELNRRVRQVAFCCTVQIFFPYSLQLHPNAFPGDSPDDCPRNINKEKSVSTLSNSRVLLTRSSLESLGEILTNSSH